MPFKTPVALLSAMLAAMPASALYAQGIPLTLDSAVAKALQNAPALRGADASMQAADAAVSIAALRPNPSLSVEAEGAMGSGRYAGFGGSERTVSLSVPLELGGKREARIAAAEADRRAASLGASSARLDVTYRVTEAFIALAAAEHRLVVSRNGNDLAIQAAHAARERVRTGKASPIEEQRAGVVLINAGVKLGKAQRALSLAHADLVRLTGDQSDTAIRAGWFAIPSTVPTMGSAGVAPSVTAAQAQLDAAGARIEVAKRDRIPDVTITVGTRRYGDSSDRAMVLGLSVPLPLFNSGTAALTRTRAEYDRAQAEREAVVLDTQQAIAHGYAEVADAEAAARASNGPALAAAEEAARIARIGYAEGKFAQLELIEAERSLAETREAAIDALGAFHLAQARLARLQGNPNPIYKD